MSDGGYWRLSATELLDGYRRRDFSPVEVTREVFERIEADRSEAERVPRAERGRRDAGS